MTADGSDGGIDRRTLLRLSALAAGSFAVDGIGTAGAQDQDDREEWTFETGAPIWMQPAVGAGTVYVGDLEGVVHAVDAETATREWQHDTGDVVRAAPALANGRVYVGTDSGSLLALDATNGQADWEHTTAADQMGGPTVGPTNVYAGTTDGDLVALDATTGDHEWTFQTDGDIEVGPPIVAGGVVYSGNRNGTLYALNTSDGTADWSFSAGDEILVVVKAGDTIYAPSRDGTLYAVNATTGDLEWEHDAGDPLFSAVYESGYVVAGGESELHAIDVSDQSEAWTTDRGGLIWNYPATADGTIYLGDGTDVLALDVTNGDEQWRFEADHSVNEAGPRFADGTLYIGSSDLGSQANKLYALDAGVEDDDPEKIPDITGFHPVHVDGSPHGHAGEEPGEDEGGEWEDAHRSSRELISDGTAPDLSGEVFLKAVGRDRYLGLFVPPEELERTDAFSPDQFERVVIYLDRSGTDELAEGDVRVIGRSARESDDPTRIRWELQLLQNGEFVTITQESDFQAPASAAAGDLRNGGFGVESCVNLGVVDEILGNDSLGDLTRINAEIRSGGISWGLDFDPSSVPATYEITGRGPGDPSALPIDRTGIDRIEVTQAVQDENNSLPLVRNKQTLARVFVDNPVSESITVDVQLYGYMIRDNELLELNQSPLIVEGFEAPPTPDRTEESHSANFRLPTLWTSSSTLSLVAKVNRQNHIRRDESEMRETVGFDLHETVRPRVHVGRVDEAMNAGRPSENDVRVLEQGVRQVLPIEGFAFDYYDEPRIENVAADDDLISRLDEIAADLQAVKSNGVDQAWGITQNYPGAEGYSSPSWGNGPDNHRAAWADTHWYPTLMAHEFVHNVGGADWGKHCSDDSDFDDGHCKINELGWSPNHGLLPDDTTDLMKSGTLSGPTKWISPERWKLAFDLFTEEYTIGDPEHPDWKDGSTSTDQSSSHTDGTASTVRLVTGTLYRDGGGTLDPSFERPGSTTQPTENAADPDAVLEIEYADGTHRIEFTKSFERLHGDGLADESSVSFTVPDGGEIEAIRLLDGDTEEELDSYVATDFQITDASLDVPGEFARDEARTVGVDVQATPDVQLYRRLLYSPDDGETWLPYSDTFMEDSLSVSVRDGPGGESARFLLLVSDGVRTERVESSPFVVEPRPPRVRIEGVHEWVREDDEVVDRGGTVEAVVGSTVELRATATDQNVDDLPSESLEWSLVDQTGNPVSITGSETGEQFRYRFTQQGRFTVTATGTDPETGLTASDEIDVNVTPPPLPDKSALRQFRGEGPEPVVGEDPPQDLNGDGLYRDVDGSGEFTIGDVQLFFQHRDSDAVQNNPELFNFDGSDPAGVTIGDVQALFADLVEGDHGATDLDVDPASLSADEVASLLGDE